MKPAENDDWRAAIVPEVQNEVKVCPDCGALWIFTLRDRTWFMAKRLQMPRRCEPCRAQRRQQESTDGMGAIS